jgi:hypothetical protein
MKAKQNEQMYKLDRLIVVIGMNSIITRKNMQK